MNKALAPYKPLLEDLKRAHGNGRLAHGYIFFGEDVAGRRAAAEALAAFLEHGTFTAEGVLSERLLVGPDAEGTIGIDAVRRAQEFLWQTPQASSRRLVVFDAAEEFSDQAEHALLKITEEPPAHGLIIIQAHDPGILLPTIQSRFQKLHFGKGEAFAALPKEAEAYAKKFLETAPRGRSQMIRELLDDDSVLLAPDKDARVRLLLSALMRELRVNAKKNAPLLRLVLQKYALLGQYNVNKRLQLEVINQAL